MQKDVSEIPTVELKATAFDLTKQVQFLQNQLAIIEQELIRRAQAAQQASQGPIPRVSDVPVSPDGVVPRV